MIDQGFRVFLDFEFFFGFSGFLDSWFFGILDLGFSLDFHSFFQLAFLRIIGLSEPLLQSYLTIQTYNRKGLATREETLYFQRSVFTRYIVDLRYT